MLSSFSQALFKIGCTLISSYYLWGSFAKIPLKHNSYFSEFWIKWYSLCYPKLCLRLSSWQNKAGISGTDLLFRRRRMTATTLAPQGQSVNRSLSFPSFHHTPVHPFLSCILIQEDCFCCCSSSGKMTSLHVFGTLCLGLLGKIVTPPTESSMEAYSPVQSLSKWNQAPLTALCGPFMFAFYPTRHSSSAR